MARSTAHAKDKCPEGMHKVMVINTNIKDSCDRYCHPGDFAFLTPELAQHYLDLQMVRVELPDLEDAGTSDEGGAEAAGKQSEAEGDSGAGNGKRRSRASANAA